MDRKISIYMLGSPSLQFNGIPVYEKRKKLLGIIFYLAAEQRPISRDKLQLLFWPDFDASSAKHNLNVTLYEIRKKYPGLLENVDFGSSVQISADIYVDVRDFSLLLSSAADEDDILHGIMLYNGEFLNDFQLGASSDFDEWKTTKAAKISSQYIDALTSLAEIESNNSNFIGALKYINKALDSDPYREDLYRRLMIYHSRHGDYLQVQQTYEKLRKILRNEIGIDPMAETQELYNAIMQESFSSAEILNSFKNQLRSRIPEQSENSLLPFIGREQELEKALKILKSKPHQLLLVRGRPGMGKTRFVYECIKRWDGIVLYGVCPKFNETINYQPITEAIMSIVTSDGWKQQYTGFKRQFNSVLWQNLRWLIPEIDPYESSPPIAPSSQQALMDAIKRFIFILSKNDDVLLIIDDLHSASQDTISLLSSIFNDPNQGQMNYICTDRPAIFNPYIARFIQKADYSGMLHYIMLERLDEHSVKRFSDLITPDDSSVFSWLETRTSGNVFCMIAYVKHALHVLQSCSDKDEGIKALIESDEVPSGISSYILHSILLLSPLASRVLYTASVYGLEFSFESVAHNVGLSEDETLSVLQELMHYSFIRSKPNGNYCFDQTAVRDALYADLSPAYRNLIRKKIN